MGLRRNMLFTVEFSDHGMAPDSGTEFYLVAEARIIRRFALSDTDCMIVGIHSFLMHTLFHVDKAQIIIKIRVREVPRIGHRQGLFHVAEGLLIVIFLAKDHCQIVVCIFIIGAELNRFLKVPFRFNEVILLKKREAPVIISFGIIRP